MEWTGATKGDEGVLPGIESAIDGKHPNGIRHVLVSDVDDCLCGLQTPETNPAAELVELGFRLRHAEWDRAAEEVLRVQAP